MNQSQEALTIRRAAPCRAADPRPRAWVIAGVTGTTAWKPPRGGRAVRITIGSGPDADWIIHAAGLAAIHAELYWDGKCLWVGSYAGSLLGGVPLSRWKRVEGRQDLALGAAVIALEGGTSHHPAATPPRPARPGTAQRPVANRPLPLLRTETPRRGALEQVWFQTTSDLPRVFAPPQTPPRAVFALPEQQKAGRRATRPLLVFFLVLLLCAVGVGLLLYFELPRIDSAVASGEQNATQVETRRDMPQSREVRPANQAAAPSLASK